MNLSPLRQGALLLALTSAATAQSVVTHVIPVPPDVLQNNIIFATLVGPPGGCVVEVRAHLEFTPSGTFTADDLLIELGAPVLPSFPDWMLVGGPDLGWGATPGTWTANVQTHSLDGEMSTGLFGGTVWHLAIEAAPGSGHSGVSGQFQNSYYEIDYMPACGFGDVYCHSNPNSSGSEAGIFATGSAVVADNDLTLHADQLPASSLGYFLMSETQGSTALFGGSQGNLCLGGTILRFSLSVLDSGPAGEVSLSPDLNQLPQGATIQVGSAWNFQYWFRDANPGPTSNTSAALEVTFQ